MANNNPHEKPKSIKYLTREEILDIEEPAIKIPLPSGKNIKVKYLSLNLVVEIMESVEDLPEEIKPQSFTEMAVKSFLRENTESKLSVFSEEDQEFLIAEAVRQWGCEDEYEANTNIESPAERFYIAANDQEKKLRSKLIKSLGVLDFGLTPNSWSNIEWFENYQKDIKNLMTPTLDSFMSLNVSSDLAKSINLSILDEVSSIGTMMEPISNIIEQLANNLKLPFEDALMESTNKMLDSFNNTMRDIASISVYSQLPEVVRYNPVVEMYNTSVVMGQLMEDEDDWQEQQIIVPKESGIYTWLKNLDASFYDMLKGAEKSIYSQNPDKCRHFASSHRELETHLLHFFSPDELVRDWTDDPNYFHNGRPTRRARLKYIARNYHNKKFVEFFIDDGHSQMKLLNADQHRLSHSYGEQELLILHERFLSWLAFLEKIVHE